MKSNASDDDGFDAFVSCAPVSAATAAGSKPADDLVNVSPDAKSAAGGKTNEEEDFFNQKAPEQKKLDKESILKLYESSNPVQNKLFNLTSSATPLQPMNLNGQFSNPLAGTPANGIPTNNNPLSSNSLFPAAASSSNVISNGFANFSNQPPASNQLNQQPPPFLAFNQTNASVIPSSSTLPQSSTNPFLINAPPATNGASSNLPSTDLFSSSNLQPVTTLGSQLNGLNLTANDTAISSISWPTNNNNISTGQSLFSANFDQLNASPSDKKLNGVLPPQAASLSSANPFLSNAGTTPIPASNLDILSAFGSSATNGLSNLGSLNGLNKSNSENWSTLHTSTTNNGLTANNGLTSGLADIWQ